MKRSIKNTMGLPVMLACAAMSFVACQKDYIGKYEMTDGTPTVYYVRPTDSVLRDSLLTGALLGETVCIVGDNLTSVQKILFNDKEAILNINYVTKNTLIVTVPAERSENITNKIYFINQMRDTTEYDFTVRMPVPMIRRIVCEVVPEGDDVVVSGDYFFDDDPENKPLKIRIGTGYTVPAEDIVDIRKTSVTFKAPSAEVTGTIQIETIYGVGAKSQQIFRDDRGLITSFEEGFTGGWGRPAEDAANSLFGEDPEVAISGRYVIMEGALNSVEGWGGGPIVNIWSQDNATVGMTDPLFPDDPATSILKMEVYVSTPWSGTPMTFLFAPTGDNENCLWADTTQPRGFWVPWQTTGSYTSGGWETISIPIADCKFSGGGEDLGIPKAFGQLTISLHNRGMAAYDGTPSSPVIYLDNVRVVPGQ